MSAYAPRLSVQATTPSGEHSVRLVLFSYAFFFKGFTGLAITIGAIITLFVVMQMTARIEWGTKGRGGTRVGVEA